jgi:serine/threonine protein kinase
MKQLDRSDLPEGLELFEDSEQQDRPAEASLPMGSLVGGKYLIKRVLGSGGNGAVYEGEHATIGHRVAIKVARLAQDERAYALARFSREARICGSLRHPNVGQVYDVGMLEDGSPYMVMELQEGRSLGDVFDEMRLPIVALIDITRQLLAGLGAAHSAGVIHRDIKPDNVMIVRDVKGGVVVKLVDFGISKTAQADVDSGKTDEDVIIGSPDYMAPEQFRGGTIDVRTDLYAVGVLLYEGVTGRLPFEGETIADLLVSVLHRELEPPTTLRPDCPPELERIVLTAMSRDPAMRPHSADQMSRALDQVSAQRQDVATNLDGLSEQSHSKRPTGGQRRRTADLRTLQDLGAKVEVQTHPTRVRRIAMRAAGGAAVVALLLGLWSLRSTPAPVSHPQQPALAPTSPFTPPPRAPADQAQPTPVAPSAEAPARDSELNATPSQRADERISRVTRSRPARRGAAATPAASKQAPAAPPPPAPPTTSAADATATAALLREAAIAFVHGEAERARSLYLQVLARDPARADAYRGVGLASARLDRRAEAAHAFERYLQMRPNAPDVARIRAELAKLQ